MTRDRFTFVQKVSKFCNLRCTYCYEYHELADPRRMNLSDLRREFVNIRGFLDETGIGEIAFVWHGGEPFLAPIEYYEEVGRLQHEIFNKLSLSNAVQTNLTVLTPRHIAFLREGSFFSELGVSFDVYGDQRIDVAGRLRTGAVLRNMQMLIDHGIPFGAITVLARNTLPYLQDIYHFFDDLGISARILAFYKQADERQAAAHALTYSELLQAYKTLFDLWAASPRATPVDPIESFVDGAVRVLCGAPVRSYSMKHDENVFLVGPDGSVWGEAEVYEPAYRYGNLVEDSLTGLLASPGRTRAIVESEQRVNAICDSCPFRSYCSGEFVATATPSQRMLLQHQGCLRREMLSYVVERLEQEDLGIEGTSAPALLGPPLPSADLPRDSRPR